MIFQRTKYQKDKEPSVKILTKFRHQRTTINRLSTVKQPIYYRKDQIQPIKCLLRKWYKTMIGSLNYIKKTNLQPNPMNPIKFVKQRKSVNLKTNPFYWQKY